MKEETISNFLPEFKLYECTEPKHDSLSYIHFENGYAYAATPHIAVRARLADICNIPSEQVAMLEGRSIYAKTFKNMLEYPEVIVTERGFEVPNERTPMFFGFNAQTEFKFPDAENIVSQYQSKLADAESVNAIGINLKYLNKLCKAMNITSARFDFNAQGAILVRSVSDVVLDIVGIIMPMHIDEEE